MRYVNPAEWIHLPAAVALCPQCGEELVVWIDEWETDTGKITEGGFTAMCGSDDDADGEHQYWYDEWVQVDAKVYRWLSAYIRVAKKSR